MELRTQKKGPGQKKWTTDELRLGFEEFFKEHGHYPTGPEIDTYQFLPSSRSIERSYGGLVSLRKELNIIGQHDFRTGEHSTKRAFKINQRANKVEQTVYEYLCNQFSKEFVHREFFFADDARTRVDFFVYDKTGNFCVDVFFPSDYRNLIGCLNSKLQKYTEKRMPEYPTIFLQMNSDIPQSDLDKLVANKTKKLLKNQYLMGWEEFTEFCKNRKPQVLAK